MPECKCVVCQRIDGLDSHHIFPIAYGGPEDGEQVWLCSLCHRNIHTVANRVYSGKTDNIQEMFSEVEWPVAKILIQAIVNAKIRMESSGRPPDAVRRLMITIPSKLYVELTRKKLDSGFSSMEKYLTAVLTKAVQ